MITKARIGVLGGARGFDFAKYSAESDRAELVAVCDKDEGVRTKLTREFRSRGYGAKIYASFDEFIKEPMDGVVLANAADEHAPFAIECLARGISVMSEVMPAKTVGEAADLVDAVEKSGAIWCYGENYCYLEISREMKRLCDKRLLGNIEYAEGEYFHDCEPIWHEITYGQKEHWRNKKHAFYYCTHSLGPIIHATGLKPVSVMGFEPPHNDRMAREGALGAPFAVEIVTLENGAIVRSCHGQASKYSNWYSLTGTLGRIESPRDAQKNADGTPINVVYTSLDNREGESCDSYDKYVPQCKIPLKGELYLHAFADYLLVENFISALRGEECDIIDVYEAMDMFLPGLFAYKSALAGIPQKVPDFRNKQERDLWRSDRSCTNPKAAGETFIPSHTKGNPQIDDSVYAEISKKWTVKVRKEQGDDNES